jgi:hypothetical protein
MAGADFPVELQGRLREVSNRVVEFLHSFLRGKWPSFRRGHNEPMRGESLTYQFCGKSFPTRTGVWM